MCPTPQRPADPPGRPSGRSPIHRHWPAGGEAAPQEETRADVGMLVASLYPGSASRRARALVREVLQGAGVPGADVADAETVVAELAANCERHGRPPYEIRLYSLGDLPTWCEVVDGDPDLRWIPAVLDRPRDQTVLDLFAENGRGLHLVRELSQGHCHAYPTTIFTTGVPAKAVAFGLPTRSGLRVTCPPLLHLARHRARLLL
ncbi:ATP-binding protein [Sphaerisporangium dianthi]|uniref:ATP-binding protein n=1 Tax=Sphaerisporangium dianthi TaxID=1436120 RepID=A0ABV9CUK0_9ACTN